MPATREFYALEKLWGTRRRSKCLSEIRSQKSKVRIQAGLTLAN